MIRKSSTNPFGESTRRKIDQLYTCLRYCEDDFRCRRTMQLEFFGESFHRNKCRATCDNCRAGREIDKRDLTEVAKTMLTLLSSIQAQKRNGLGVTLLQLTELFRGSKAKGSTKFLNVSQLNGYGDADRFKLKKKQDIDRIAHAMIFERIIVEVSEQNKQGFSSDYVQPAENAAAIQSNRKRFLVDFPKGGSKSTENNEAPAEGGAPGNKKKRKKSPARKKRTSATSKTGTGTTSAGASSKKSTGSGIIEIDDDDDDDETEFEDGGNDQSAILKNPLIPRHDVKELEKRVMQIVIAWANEEKLMGNPIYYWHILTNPVIKAIASQCPTTIDELKALDGIAEQKANEYGHRLVKIVQAFIKEKNLEETLAQKKEELLQKQPAKKRRLDQDSESQIGSSSNSAKPLPPPIRSGTISRGGLSSNGGGNADEVDEFPLDLDPADLADLDKLTMPHNKSKYFA